MKIKNCGKIDSGVLYFAVALRSRGDLEMLKSGPTQLEEEPGNLVENQLIQNDDEDS